MNYKLKGAINRSKKSIIVFLILWICFSIVLVSSVTVAIVEASAVRESRFINLFRDSDE